MNDDVVIELQRMLDDMKMKEAIAKVSAKHGAPYATSGVRAKSGVHISISVSPSDGATLEKDVQYVKAALLYADHVTLSSPAAAMLTSIVGLAELKPVERVEFLRDLMPIMKPGPDSNRNAEFMRKLAQEMRKRKPWEPESGIAAQLRPVLEEVWPQMVGGIMEQGEKFGVFELAAPLKSGVLDIVPMESWHDTDQLIKTYFDRLVDACADPFTIPLLDDNSADLISKALGEGIVTLEREQTPMQKHGVLAANLFDRLPAFPELSILQTMELRSDLEPYLKRFRAEMLDLSAKLGSASWSADFVIEVEEVFVREVLPAMMDIDDKLKHHTLTRSLFRSVLSTDVATSTGLGVMLTSHAGLTQYGAVVGAALGAARQITKEVEARKKAEQEAKANGLFLYHQASQELGEPI